MSYNTHICHMSTIFNLLMVRNNVCITNTNNCFTPQKMVIYIHDILVILWVKQLETRLILPSMILSSIPNRPI